MKWKGQIQHIAPACSHLLIFWKLTFKINFYVTDSAPAILATGPHLPIQGQFLLLFLINYFTVTFSSTLWEVIFFLSFHWVSAKWALTGCSGFSNLQPTPPHPLGSLLHTPRLLVLSMVPCMFWWLLLCVWYCSSNRTMKRDFIHICSLH